MVPFSAPYGLSPLTFETVARALVPAYSNVHFERGLHSDRRDALAAAAPEPEDRHHTLHLEPDLSARILVSSQSIVRAIQ